MSEATELHINAAKKAELEFDVHIQGITSDDPMEVRFVIKDADLSLLFNCECVEDAKWCVKFPALNSILKQSSYDFSLEVIIDGYFFVPAEGKIVFVSKPTVDMGKKKKPSVKASFTVKQDEEDVKESVVEERVAQGAGDASDQSAPTNALLTPEKEPDVQALIAAQHRAEDEEDEEETVKPKEAKESFDPHRVADSILKSTFGNVQAPQNKGFLFKRSGDGKPVITGLEDKATKQQLEEKAAKVRKILASE